jgi:cytochrome b561
MAALIIAVFWLGFTMVDLPLSLVKMKTYALHKSLGVTVLALWLVRVLWRSLAEPTPQALPASPWAHRLAHVIHGVLYLSMASLPLTGWWYNSAAGFPLQVFGLFNLPHLVAADPVMKSIAHNAHVINGWVLLACVGLHVAGALKHHFVDRDVTLVRMLGWGKRP